MRIISEIAKVTTACAGMEGFDAEVVLEEVTDKGFERIYVHANEYTGFNYTVAKESSFSDEFVDLDVLEEYNSLDAAKDSKYYKYFLIADRMIKDLCQFD